MKYPFSVFQMESDGHVFWVAKSIYLKGCVGQGDTQDEAIRELSDNEIAWLKTAEEIGIPIPSIQPVEQIQDYSGKLTLRTAPNVHRMAALFAKMEGISLNQYINDALVSQNARLSKELLITQ